MYKSKRQIAWLEIGLMFSLEEEERTEDQRLSTKSGLCYALERSSIKEEQAILDAIGSCNNFWSPIRDRRKYQQVQDFFGVKLRAQFTKEHDYTRALFAFLMAAMSDKERKALV